MNTDKSIPQLLTEMNSELDALDIQIRELNLVLENDQVIVGDQNER